MKDFFERVYVINLASRPDRRRRLESHLGELGLASPKEIEWVRAVSGDACAPPAYFLAGGGAWGCLQSHLRIVQDAIMDGLSNYLVLEDDVIFHHQASAHLKRLMAELPDHWDQLYLGGQHLAPPEQVSGSPFLFLCNNVNRTHAFALQGKAFRRFHQHIAHAPDYIEKGSWHIDHQLGLAHERRHWSTYAPTWWLAGQVEGESNIRGCPTPRFWWHYEGYSESLPFIHFPDCSAIERWQNLSQQMHFGNNLKANTLEDSGLDECVGSPEKLGEWLKMIAREAMDHWKLPGISHPLISIEDVSAVWASGALRESDASFDQLLAYPENGLFAHALNSHRGNTDFFRNRQ